MKKSTSPNYLYQITRGTRVLPDICTQSVWNKVLPPAAGLDFDHLNHPQMNIHRMKTVKAKWIFVNDDVLMKSTKSWLVRLSKEAASYNCFWVRPTDIE